MLQLCRYCQSTHSPHTSVHTDCCPQGCRNYSALHVRRIVAHSGIVVHSGIVAHSGIVVYSGNVVHSGIVAHSGIVVHSGFVGHSGFVAHSGFVVHSGFVAHSGIVAHSGRTKWVHNQSVKKEATTLCKPIGGYGRN